MRFDDLFSLGTTHSAPHQWQSDLAAASSCENRLINVPTGFGKTEGVVLAWLWNRVGRRDPAWPRRLLWCLPMRVLVEQTAARVEDILDRLSTADTRWTGILVHRLMGGVDINDWHLEPEREAVLVGTQDMLLSRALNRGYAVGRARWPMEYGLLNQDCLWVMDEVQLMDVGLVTSVQLQAFRQMAPMELRPCRTWWMSATLQPSWLATPESAPWLPNLEERVVRVRPDTAPESIWGVSKGLTIETLPLKEDRKQALLGRLIWEAHVRTMSPAVTLVVVNRVDTALHLAQALERLRTSESRQTEVHVLHSRFRPRDRRDWSRTFLSRSATEYPTVDRIVLATQVVEAGVDVTCTLMITELAPWPSLVQRFGRVARYGGSGSVIVVDRVVSGRDALPYTDGELLAAGATLRSLQDAGLASLVAHEASLSDGARAALFPYAPLHVLTPRENEELFDTTPDLTGADLDISRFIRSDDERDVSVAWLDASLDQPPAGVQPGRDDLCPVPVRAIREWLFDSARLKVGCDAWVWDYLDGRWRRPDSADVYPGQIVLVSAGWGGYDTGRGFTGEPLKATGEVPYALGVRTPPAGDLAECSEARDDLSECDTWKTIATHGKEVAAQASRLFAAIGLEKPLGDLAELAGRLHDWGKAHPAFRACILADDALADCPDLAKAPDQNWLPQVQLYREAVGDTVQRRGLRHELASVLAIFELLADATPYHAGIVGPYVGTGLVDDYDTGSDPPVVDLVAELSALSADDLDLLAYLVASHHGKVRAALCVTPHDQEYPLERREPERGLPLRGIRQGDVLPSIRLYTRTGTLVKVPAVALQLDLAAMGLSRRYGPSWRERVLSQLSRFGPFGLAFLEALFRTADVRATRVRTPDALIQQLVQR